MTTQAPQKQPIKMPEKEGEVLVLKGRALTVQEDGYSPHQYGESVHQNLELMIRLNVPDLGKVVTTPLSFSAAAAVYSWERLRALGKEDDDISHLRGIDKNEVVIEFRGEVFEGKFRVKAQIVTGAGNFDSKNPIDPKTFAAKLQAQSGKGMPTAGAGKPEAPPF